MSGANPSANTIQFEHHQQCALPFSHKMYKFAAFGCVRYVCSLPCAPVCASESSDSTIAGPIHLYLFKHHFHLKGCTQITSIDFNLGLDPPRRLLLQFLDLTDCCALDDSGLKIVVQNCPQLVYLYLRRCTQISGM